MNDRITPIGTTFAELHQHLFVCLLSESKACEAAMHELCETTCGCFCHSDDEEDV